MLVAVKLARYWTRASGEATGPDGRPVRVTARGWSNESLEAARELARSTARRLAERLVAPGTAARAYLYGERPLPEPIVREFPGGGTPGAVVTRNAYGALVLNARQLMFVDIDRDDPAPSASAGDLVSGILSLFGKAAPAPPRAADGVLAGIQRVAEANGLAVRVYKTAGGYRAIVTDAPHEAGAPSERLFQEFGADPLYVRLCRLQQSFRARLTPKPWRCGLRVPPATFPYETPQDEARVRAWEADYAKTAGGYATCRYLTTFGGARVAPGFEDLIRYHDQETRAETPFPLA
jgi:hypothetical protein